MCMHELTLEFITNDFHISSAVSNVLIFWNNFKGDKLNCLLRACPLCECVQCTSSGGLKLFAEKSLTIASREHDHPALRTLWSPEAKCTRNCVKNGQSVHAISPKCNMFSPQFACARAKESESSCRLTVSAYVCISISSKGEDFVTEWWRASNAFSALRKNTSGKLTKTNPIGLQ